MKATLNFLFIVVCFFLTACSTGEKKQLLAKSYLDLGTSFYNEGRYPEALREITKAQKMDPHNPIILNGLGLTYHARGRTDLGIQALREALSIDPNYTEARNNLVRILIEAKDFKAAEKELAIVKKDLTYGALDKVYINEGLLYYDQKKYSRALEPFAKAIEYSRENCPAHNFYGRSLFEVKKYNEAAIALDRAVAFCQKTGNDEPHYFSALAHYRAGDKRKAIVRFEEIIQLYPNGQYFERSRALLEMVRKEL